MATSGGTQPFASNFFLALATLVVWALHAAEAAVPPSRPCEEQVKDIRNWCPLLAAAAATVSVLTTTVVWAISCCCRRKQKPECIGEQVLRHMANRKKEAQRREQLAEKVGGPELAMKVRTYPAEAWEFHWPELTAEERKAPALPRRFAWREVPTGQERVECTLTSTHQQANV